MQAALEKYADSEAPLQLLLFVDGRISSRKHIQRIQSYLKTLRTDYPFELTVVDVGEQPYLAEHYKLVATPALIKIHPKPRQTLAGSNLVAQLKNWWPRWQRSVEEHQAALCPGVSSLPSAHNASNSVQRSPSAPSSITSSIELIRLSDEIFRLKQEKEELLEQLRFKEHVISMLAHDLRSPLTAASIALETLELEHRPKEGCTSELTPALKSRLLKQARSQFRSMERMITDLLQSARGNSSEFQLRPKKLHVGRLCEDVLTQMSERFELKSQQVDTDIPQDLPYVYADEELVRQVLVNLLDNANKYTPIDGNIHVSILHRTTQKIQVSVCDNGPGIPEENRDRIFEDHFRLKRDQEKDGYGLGLSLCQKVIRAHYGRIWVESAPKGGGCFHFTLPIYL